MRSCFLLFLIITLISCGAETDLPPVEELKWQPLNHNQARHVVQRGETLYAVAFRYDKDFRQLAAFNHLSYPYALRVGQVLQLRYPNQSLTSHQSYQVLHSPSWRKPTMVKPLPQPIVAKTNYGFWQWPVKGRIVANFMPHLGKKGIDIAGSRGDMVRAASSGTVAYAGNGLSGYGNLIIIKHEGQLLTAYGNNATNKVKEGQSVKAGQVIAEIGLIDRRFWGVHFEIRKAGQPVNPLSYLK